MITLNVNGKPRDAGRPRRHAAAVDAARRAEHDRHEVRLRHGPVRRVHDSDRRTADAVLHHAGFGRGREADHDHRGDRSDAGGQEDPGGVARARRAAVRLLPVRPDHVGERAARRASRSRATRTSTTRWRATSAAAAPIRASAPRSSRPRASTADARRCEMKTAIDRNSSAARPPSRRNFLKLTATAAIGGGLLLGFGLPCTRRGPRQSHDRCAVRAERVPAHRSHRQSHVRDAGHRDGAGDLYLDPDADRRRARGRRRQGRDRALAARRQGLCESARSAFR